MRAALQFEIVALRHQLLVLHRTRSPRLALTATDRLLWVWLSRMWSQWRSALVIVKPETVIASAVVTADVGFISPRLLHRGAIEFSVGTGTTPLEVLTLWHSSPR